MTGFIEVYAYYLVNGDYVNYQINLTNTKEWNDTYGEEEDLTGMEAGKFVIDNPERFGITRVYADADDKKFFEKHGIKTKPMSNSLYVDIPKKYWRKLAEITRG